MPQKNPINQAVALDERVSRGLSKSQMAEVIGIEGTNAEQIITDFETGFRPIKGPALRVYQLLNRARWAGATLLKLPSWTVSVRGDDGACLIHHNAWPRFVARAFDVELHPEQWQFRKAGMPAFALDPRTGYKQLVASFIDHVPSDFDPQGFLAEAGRRLESELLGLQLEDSQKNPRLDAG
jgi:hypothetical protein